MMALRVAPAVYFWATSPVLHTNSGSSGLAPSALRAATCALIAHAGQDLDPQADQATVGQECDLTKPLPSGSVLETGRSKVAVTPSTLKETWLMRMRLASISRATTKCR